LSALVSDTNNSPQKKHWGRVYCHLVEKRNYARKAVAPGKGRDGKITCAKRKKYIVCGAHKSPSS